MSKKSKVVFVCQECGFETPKWMGQCICGAWNTFVEEKVVEFKEDDSRRRSDNKEKVRPVCISQVKSANVSRIDTRIKELNRVLGGGLVEGSLILISGEPGIGKSTLIIQAAAMICSGGKKVLYVTGEESEEQIKIRADRVCSSNLENLFLLAETNMESIIKIQEELRPDFIIIDSIQTMYSDELESAPGSVSQVRACGNLLMRVGKGRNIPIFIVAHVTKNGDLAGPKILEHLVDCVLSFTGERNQDLRILRSVKNRYGTTSEIGAFEMKEEGLVEIENLSRSFLEGMEENTEGSVATAIYEGTRPLLLEVQALTAQTNMGFPRRTTVGVDISRLNIILAVLERKVGVNFSFSDVYVNIVGGIKPEGTSIDLGVALCVYSSIKGISFPNKTIAIGEIGLTGDLRSIQNSEKIIKEASRMGFRQIILPEKNAARISDIPQGVKLIGVKSIKDAVDIIG